MPACEWVGRENKGAWNDFDRAAGAGAVPKHDDQIIDPNGQGGESAAERKASSLPPLLRSTKRSIGLDSRTDRSPNQDVLAFVILPSLFPQREVR